MSEKNVEYMATKKNEVLTYTSTWVNLENIRLKVARRKRPCCMIHYYEPSRTDAATETERQLGALRAEGVEGGVDEASLSAHKRALTFAVS